MADIQKLLETANRLPLRPGVYIMKDKSGKVIYVGKSRKLKNRVSQYFQSGEKNVKTSRMVASVESFDYILCDTETEALALENSLIKQYLPKYNIKLKDAKSYPYIKVTVEEEYPRMFMTRTRLQDRARYFGPYSSAPAVNNAISTIQKTFGLHSCKRKFPNDIGNGRPCLYKQLGQCSAPCDGSIGKEEYREKVMLALDVLKGKNVEVKAALESKMLEYAESEQYEAAARCRDSLSALERLGQRQKVIGAPDLDEDVIALFSGELCSCISVFYIRGGTITDNEHFIFPAEEIVDESNISAFVCDLYMKREYIPREILLAFKLDREDEDALSGLVSGQAGRKVNIRTPDKGEARKLCNMVYDNAEQNAKLYLSETEKSDKAAVLLASMLSLEVVPERIEAYDISNIGSEHKTAGMIVFENGKFKRSDYRIFTIKNVEGTDDYACMREALSRRLAHIKDEGGAFSVRPDLILLDGGHGHVSTAKDVLSETGIDIPVFGMVKDDYHKTRALTDGELEISIAREQSVFTMIYKIQEEVHRFTVSAMSGAKRKTLKTSSLEKIKGIGQTKAKKLLSHFGGITKIKEAEVGDIEKVKGISKSDAEAIYRYYH